MAAVASQRPRVFVDTNILLYSLSRSPAEAQKRARALAVLETPDCALSVQVLQEFYWQTSRGGSRLALPHRTAVGLIVAWTRMPVQSLSVAVLADALALRERTNYSYWDCAIIAAATALGCSEILSEDLQHGHTVDGIRITNPFL